MNHRDKLKLLIIRATALIFALAVPTTSIIGTVLILGTEFNMRAAPAMVVAIVAHIIGAVAFWLAGQR